MDAELKAKWVEALRSGKYRQARKALRSAEGFCCLGVLCDIAAPKGWRPAEEHRSIVDHVFDGADMCEIDDPNRRELGLPGKLHYDLIDMNDGGSSFAEIADYIESHLGEEGR